MVDILTMYDLLFWIYLINAVCLVNHEIDSAYWREWDLFKLPGGMTGFLVIHFPLLFVLLYGLIMVFQRTSIGLILSLMWSAAGIFAFSIHMFFIKRGRHEFRTFISIFILGATFVVSLLQAVVTLLIFNDLR